MTLDTAYRDPGDLTRASIQLPALVCLVFVLLQLAAGPSWTLFPDSYRYARAAEQVLGASPEQAHRAALAAFCTSRADRAAAEARLQPNGPSRAGTVRAATERACLDRWRDARDITTADPRYQAIFSSRPGYPVVAAPFVAAFGVLTGLRVLGVLVALAGSLLVVGLLRAGGLDRRAATVGQVAFLACPLGWWSLQALGEGLFTVCALGALTGAVLLLRGRHVARAAAGTALALAAGGVTRYSSSLLLAALLAAVAVAAYGAVPRWRHRGTLLLAAVTAAIATTTAAAIRLLDLPSATTTVQDTFTHHFDTPDVADPWTALLLLAVRFWRQWLADQAAAPAFVVLTLLAVVALTRSRSPLGPPAVASALTGIGTITAHPLVQEADRLGVLMWVPMVVGLPLLASGGVLPPGARPTVRP